MLSSKSKIQTIAQTQQAAIQALKNKSHHKNNR